jgi:hypothetical protein
MICDSGVHFCRDDNTCHPFANTFENSDLTGWYPDVRGLDATHGDVMYVSQGNGQGSGSIAITASVHAASLSPASVGLEHVFCGTPLDLSSKTISVDLRIEGPQVAGAAEITATFLMAGKRYETGIGAQITNPPSNQWFTLKTETTETVNNQLPYFETFSAKVIADKDWSGTLYLDNMRIE